MTKENKTFLDLIFEKEKPTTTKDKFRRGFVFFTLGLLLIAAFFYLFIFPYLYAAKLAGNSLLVFLFAMFLFFQLWMLFVDTAYSSLAQLYNLKRKHLIELPFKVKKISNKPVSGFKVFFLTMFSYVIALYGFSIIYLYLGNFHPNSFENSPLSFIEAIYFSVVAGTVGFSDISPNSNFCRVVVMAEILLSFSYTIIFFSLIASFIRESRTGDNSNNNSKN